MSSDLTQPDEQRPSIMTQPRLGANGVRTPRRMQRWFKVSTVFVLTWLAATAAIISGNRLFAEPPPPSLSRDKPAAQDEGLGAPHTSTRTRGRAKPRTLSGNPQELALLKELRSAPENGLLEHDIPSQLTIFQEQEITIRLSRGPAAEAFVHSLNDKTGEVVSVRDVVSLSLYGGKNFDIERLSPDPQSMRQNNYCLWRFNVIPKQGGKHTLEIQVNLYDSYGYVPVASYSKEIEVYVPFSSSVVLAWEDYRADWLLNYLLLPLAASIFSAWMTARMTVQMEAKSKERGKVARKLPKSAKTKVRPAPASKRTATR